MALASILILGACGDECDFRTVEAQLDWRFVGSEERGSIHGVAGDNVSSYGAIENAILDPGTATGGLVGMLDGAQVGRLRVASFGLTLPVAVGEKISGNGHAFGGWGILPTGVGEGFRMVTFEPPLEVGADAPEITQSMEVVALSPLRLRVVWSRAVAGTMMELNGEMTLTRQIRRGICQ